MVSPEGSPTPSSSSSSSSSSGSSSPLSPPKSSPPSSSSDDSSSHKSYSSAAPPPLSKSSNSPSNSKSSPPSKSKGDEKNYYSPDGGYEGQYVPPPPKLGSSKRSPSSKPSSDQSPNDDSSSNNMPLIIGITVGAGLLLLVGAVLFAICYRKKRKFDNRGYYADQPHATQGGGYYNSSQHVPRQNNNLQNDHVLNMPSPPRANHGGWSSSPPPPPPPPHYSGGDYTSSNFSDSHGPPLPPPHPSVALGFNKSTFTYDELAAATSVFAQANLLGQGGFGYVHKGVLPNGKEIAVKSLKSGSGQGDREFQAEVDIISRVHHRHLVSLVGYCIAGGRKTLVYEFMPNNNLEYHLHDKSHPPLDWCSRLRIAIGSAKGLAYLHEDCHPRIIHRDIKTANILLDFNYEAKVADFGLAKLNQDNFTHVSTRVMGTFGYMAPEYASSGKLTEKSDVFSFGVVLLELITGRRPVDNTGDYVEDSLVDWARPLCERALEEGNFDELVDPSLEKSFVPQEMARMVACAVASIRHSSRRRPKMSQVVRALEGDTSLDDLNEGVKPGQSSHYSSSGSDQYDAGSYSTDMKKFKKIALNSQEYGSSEYGNTSDQYGLNPSF